LSTQTVSAQTADAALEGDSGTPAIVGGTATVFMTKSYVANMLEHDIVITPAFPWAHSTQEVQTTTTWELKSGDLDLREGTGFAHFIGGMVVTNLATGLCMVLWDIRFNLADHTVDFNWKSPDGDFPIAGLDLPGAGQGQVIGTSGTYTVKDLYMNREAGAAMNDILKTEAFVDEGLFGGFATTFELRHPAPTDGVVQWGGK